MPIHALSVRRRSARIGRFPEVSLPGWREEDPAELKEEPVEDAVKEGACRRCMYYVCPWCRPKADDDDDDVTVVTGVDEMDKKPLPDDDGEVLLQVRSIDLMKAQTEQNRTEHRTDRYHSDNLIIRRGQTFQMWLELSRPFNAENDKLHLELKTGLLPTVAKGTHVIIPLVDGLEDDRWEAKIVRQDGNKVQLSVNSIPTAIIGLYQLTVVTQCPKGEATSKHDPTNDIYMLFNPWCEGDAVFMDDEDERGEYVLNDIGRLYYGTQHQIGARTWNYGQFDEGILTACLYILEKSESPPSGWGDPVNVVRVVSAMINSVDDSGVLMGNWSGDYTAGTSPTAWSGSVEILKAYCKAEGHPVKYGQCWVFSGITTTVMRCLGIPTRSVTNYSSAHDTDTSLTIDVFFDENLDPLDHLNADSIWNFHVWNDCWMERRDLPLGLGGWQAVDATPQETSQGTFRCGPAPLSAIRSGQVFHKHDCPFVFAEVNSDKIYWQRQEDGTFTQIYSEKKIVGHKISTKAVGSDERHDITHVYKHPEDTEEERIAVETASRHGTKPATYLIATAKDVLLEVSMDGEGPCMGDTAKLTITLQNNSAQLRTVNLHSQVAIMYYTGVHKATVKTDRTQVNMMPNQVMHLDWSLEYKDYQDQLVDQAALMLTLCGRVGETQQVIATQYSFRLRTPDLLINPIGEAVVGKKMAAEIYFTNPLPRELKEVVLRLEGPGLLTVRKIPLGNIGSNGSKSWTEHFIPSLSGPRKLLASLDCKQLTQVHGVVDITVQDK